MSSIDDGELYLEIADATEEQLQRGIVAARASLAQSGVSIEDAFLGYFDRGEHDASDTFDRMTEKTRKGAHALDDAWDAACDAACGNDRSGPISGDLGLIDVVRETQRRQREIYDMLPSESRIEPRDTGPHYTMVAMRSPPN